jgi:hypothetical protein
LYTIVAGLGISLLVRSIGQVIEARDRVRLYWVHTCWVALIFVSHVVSWFSLWGYAQNTSWTILQALLLLCIPMLLYLVSHLAVPELEDGRVHDLREYYFRHARWMQGLLLTVIVAGALAHYVIAGQLDFSGGRGIRGAMAAILLPGIISLRPAVHAVQAVLLLLVMAIAVSYVAQPIG